MHAPISCSWDKVWSDPICKKNGETKINSFISNFGSKNVDWISTHLTGDKNLRIKIALLRQSIAIAHYLTPCSVFLSLKRRRRRTDKAILPTLYNMYIAKNRGIQYGISILNCTNKYPHAHVCSWAPSHFALIDFAWQRKLFFLLLQMKERWV